MGDIRLSSVVPLMLLLTPLLGVALACGASMSLATVNLDVERLARMLQDAAMNLDPTSGSFQPEEVVLEQERILIIGEYQPPEAIPASSGTMRLNLTVAYGSIRAGLEVVDFPALENYQTTLVDYSRQIEVQLLDVISNGRQGIQIIALKITPQSLQVQFRFQP